jgi:energy-coupling factor transport system ATP-binding protein
MVSSTIYPPVIGLGRHLGWTPLPLSVRDARRRARDLRATLPDRVPSPSPAATDAAPVCTVDHLVVRRGGQPVLRGLDLTLRKGEVVALMGRNGAGKSTLLTTLVGQLVPASGRVRLGSRGDLIDPSRAKPADIVKRAGMVPQDPTSILYADSVAEECRAADRDFGIRPGRTREVLASIAPGIADDRHPRELSEGQRLSLALALILASEPQLVLLDEPTRGLDYQAKRRLVQLLRALASAGHAIVLATHDVELAAEVANRVVVLAEGEVVADGPATTVLAGSPAFAPQVAKILHPLHLLTVDEVVACTGAAS